MKWMRFIFAWVAFVTALLPAYSALAQSEEATIDTVDAVPVPDKFVGPGVRLTSIHAVVADTVRWPVEITREGVFEGTFLFSPMREINDPSLIANMTFDLNTDNGMVGSISHRYDGVRVYFTLSNPSDEPAMGIIGYLVLTFPAAGTYPCGWEAWVKGAETGDAHITGTSQVSVVAGTGTGAGGIYVPKQVEGAAGDTIAIPVEVTRGSSGNGSMKNGRLTLNVSGVSHLGFEPAIDNVSVIGSGGSDGAFEVQADFTPDEPVVGLLGHILVVANEGEYALSWDMYYPYLSGGHGSEVAITVTEPIPSLAQMSIPDTAGRVGEVLRIPVRVATGSDVPGVYSGAFGFEVPNNAMRVADSGFTPAEGVLAFTKVHTDGAIVVSFVAMPPAQGIIGHLTVSMSDLGTWESEWGGILKTDLDPNTPPHETEGKSIITGTAAFDVNVSSGTATMGDAITLTMAGGTLPFLVPSRPMEPSMLLRAEERPDARVFALVPNDLSVWPAGKRAINMTVRVYDGNNWEVPVDFQLKARIGDANADHMVNSKDVMAILRLFLDDGAPPNHYVWETADPDGDGIISPNDAAYTLYMVIGVPVPTPVPLNDTAGKRLSDIVITDDVIANALQFLRDIEDDESAEAEMARQMIYNLVGRDRLTAVGETESVPEKFGLGQNYPNPFNSATTIPYTVAKPGYVRLAVYDTVGQMVAELVRGHQPTGSYTAVWSAGDDIGTGTYFYVLKIGEYRGTGSMVLLK